MMGSSLLSFKKIPDGSFYLCALNNEDLCMCFHSVRISAPTGYECPEILLHTLASLLMFFNSISYDTP